MMIQDRFNDFLVCPCCQHDMELIRFDNTHALPDACMPSLEGGEVRSGLLWCDCGKAYPIIEGVPRLLEKGLKAYPDFVAENREQLIRLCSPQNVPDAGAERNDENDYDNIRKSFSQEWGIFDYETDKTWGWTLDERKRVFLADVNLKAEEISGKLLLDAGCGNGTLTAALSEFGMMIVGLDLNDDLGRAQDSRKKYANNAKDLVQYVQGNLVNPPLKKGVFDLIYSSGVIHHTPSSENTFASLVPLLKQGGRMYVWVYGKRGLPVRMFFGIGRSLKQFLSLRSVMWICRLIAPAYQVSARALDAIGVMKFRSRTTREITLDLFDAFAPRYNHFHSEDEVYRWFEEHGFSGIHISGVQKHGFGMYGDKT